MEREIFSPNGWQNEETTPFLSATAGKWQCMDLLRLCPTQSPRTPSKSSAKRKIPSLLRCLMARRRHACKWSLPMQTQAQRAHFDAKQHADSKYRQTIGWSGRAFLQIAEQKCLPMLRMRYETRRALMPRPSLEAASTGTGKAF